MMTVSKKVVFVMIVSEEVAFVMTVFVMIVSDTAQPCHHLKPN